MIDLKQFIVYQIREMKRELLAAIDGLSREDMVSHEPAGHWPVAWIAEHCSDVADRFLYRSVKGEFFLDHDPVILNWPKEPPEPGYPYLSQEKISERWSTLCDAILSVVDGLNAEELQTSFGNESYVESCLRVINHTHVHLRSLWCILGERRVDDKFPEQASHLPE